MSNVEGNIRVGPGQVRGSAPMSERPGHYEIGLRDGGSSWHIGTMDRRECRLCADALGASEVTLDLEVIKSRVGKASEGPWMRQPPDKGITGMVERLTVPGDRNGDWVHFTHGPKAHADADFIAHAREDIPLLIEEIERLRSGSTESSGA